jgi:hypothetical protein
VKTVSRLLHLDDGEFPALRAQIEARPIPAPPVQKPPNWGRDMIAFLRAEAPVEPRTLGMRRPAAPRPPRPFSPDLITRLAHVSTAMHADYTRHLDTMAVLDDITALLTEHPEFLTSANHHPGPRLWLRRIAAELAPFTAKAQVA